MPIDSARQELLRGLLKRVSRSFYLSLRFLPGPVREPLSLAYLLARTTDTIADTALVPAETRLGALKDLADRIAGHQVSSLSLAAFTENQGDPAERELLARASDSLDLLAHTPPANRDLIRAVLATIISGQELDLRRFQGGSARNIIALASPADLEDYTYRVAGCVGEFWTRVCFANLELHCARNEQEMCALGIRFGKGLQLINILRDLPRDLREGRCYLPESDLKSASLTPSQLLDPRHELELRPVFDQWLEVAREHLRAGWTYTNAHARRHSRLRLSCALPILIGARTLDLLGTGPILDPRQRIKVSRGAVRGLILAAILRHPVPGLWHGLAP